MKSKAVCLSGGNCESPKWNCLNLLLESFYILSQRHFFFLFCTWSWVSVSAALHQGWLQSWLVGKSIPSLASPALRSQRPGLCCGRTHAPGWEYSIPAPPERTLTSIHPSHQPGPSAGREIKVAIAVIFQVRTSHHWILNWVLSVCVCWGCRK